MSSPSHIPLDTFDESTPTHRRGNGHVTYQDTVEIAVEVEDREYESDDEDEGDDDDVDMGDTNNRLSQLPSRKITALGYNSVGLSLRRRKSSSSQNYNKLRTKSRARRPTHIYNEWRNQPDQLEMQIIDNWRVEDEDDTESITDEVKAVRRIEELRGMTINLSRKKKLRDALRKETLRAGSSLNRSKSIGCWTNLKYSWAIKREHAKNAITSTIRSLGLWEGHMKAFASHFGTDVTSYFLFLRWLFVANMLIGLLLIVFLFIPQVLYNNFIKSTNGTQTELKTDQIDRSHIPQYEKNWEGGREFLTGKGNVSSGFFENTAMYYGHYTDQLIYTDSANHRYTYNMKVSYLLTYGAYFLLYFLVLAISVAKSYRTNFIESSDKFTFQYVLKIVDGWDYNIDSASTAHTKKKNMHRDLREFCASNQNPDTIGNCCDSLMLVLFRLGAMFIMFAIVAGCGLAIYFIPRGLKTNNTDPTVRDAVVPIIVTAINTFVPFIFSITAAYLKFENPKSSVYTTLGMTMLLYGSTLGVYFATTIIPCASDELRKVIDTAQPLISEETVCVDCWETRLGEKAYSLVFLDFLFGVVVTLVSEVLRRLVTQFCCKSLEKKKNESGKTLHPQFEIARNTMAIIYNQFLLWLGIYYSPLLTVVVVIKLWLIFYIKRITVMNACIPTTKPWRAAKMHTVFLGLLFIGFILCLIMFGFAVALINPSDTCGPFLEQASAVSVVTSELNKINEDNRLVTDIILSPGVVVGVIVILCVVVHYVRVTSAGRKTLISLLKIQITLESKDKAYLRTMLDKVHRHKVNKLEPPPQQCECQGECTCGRRGPQNESGDMVPELRPMEGRNRVFAKQRSNTSSSLLSGMSDGYGSREDLSRTRLSSDALGSKRSAAKDSRTSQSSTVSGPQSYHNISMFDNSRSSVRDSVNATSTPPSRRQPHPAPRQSGMGSSHQNDEFDSYGDERF